jgi:hypothetical protein
MIELTEAQRREIQGPETPVLDPDTQQEYVLVRKDVYARPRQNEAEDDFNPREFYPLVDRIMARDDANDPSLESYQ